MIYKLNGVSLPRDANMQSKVGRPVAIDSSYSQLKPGDLLFFGTRPEAVDHVAMYIGRSQFIHSNGQVKVNSLNPKDPDYSAYRVK